MSNQEVSLQLVRVKCVDETNGRYVERLGNDEIWLAGTAVDGAGEVHKLTEFEVYAHFDDGEIKEFSPPKTLFSLKVPAGGTFPKSCEALLILAEKDSGDLTELAQKAFDETTKEMEKKKNEMGMEPDEAPPPGWWDVVKDVLKKVAYGFLRDEILRLNDDVFPIKTISLDITSEDFRWEDGTKLSPETRVEFRGHDGVYILIYYWEIKSLESPRPVEGGISTPLGGTVIHP